MKLYFLLFAFALNQISFSQSKKEQIVILTSRIDSLYQVVSLERKINGAEIAKLKANNSTLDNKNSSLTANLAKLESKNATLNISLDKLTSELQASKSESFTKQYTISSLQTQLAILSDSLVYIRSELDRLKPAPRPVVSNTVSDQVSFKGNYATVTIGNQVWMVENLNTAKFRNGDPIFEAKTIEEWQEAGDNGRPAWCYYDNKPANGVKYGKLYNWFAVNDSRGLAPAGFHVPSDDEWTTLTDYLGYVNAGKKMKTRTGWKYGVNGTNSSGFTGLPGGFRGYNGTSFFNIGGYGHWWSSSEYGNGSNSAWDRTLNYDSETPYQHNSEKYRGFSVRCIRD